MFGPQVACTALSILISFSSVQGKCPFATLTPADEAALLEPVRPKSVRSTCSDEIPQKLYIDDYVRIKRSTPKTKKTRVPRYAQMDDYDMKSTVEECLREVETTRSKMGPLYQDGGPASLPKNSSSYNHYINFRSHDTIDMSTVSRGLILATEKLKDKYSEKYRMTPHSFMQFLHNHGYDVGEMPGVCPPNPKCSKKSLYYRTMDGSCNNLYHPTWGMSQTTLVRMLGPSYSDGIYKPTISVTGKKLPSASLVSLILFQDSNRPDHLWTRSIPIWGQFVGHDMSLSSSSQTNWGPIRCCTPDQSGPLPEKYLHPACDPIEVPDFHPFYSKYGIRCLNFVRSITLPSEGCKLGYGNQGNVVTHYLDLSTIYGSSDTTAEKLRHFKGGLLRAAYSKEAGGEILPEADDKKGSCSVKSDTEPCYTAGDVRVNLHLDLTILHTLILRWHNELARKLHMINPHWDDERLYQEARRICIAGYQHIHYNEWLPIILGRKFMHKYGLLRNDVDEYGYVKDYDPEIPAAVINSHTTAAFRFFHSIVPGKTELLTPKRRVYDTKDLSDNFNKPGPLEEKNTFEGLLAGMVTQPMQKADSYFTRELTRYLFRGDKEHGFDLESIDVQRHRDHGLASYNQYRYLCGLPKAYNWEDFLDVMSAESIYKLQSLYEVPDDVELLPGCAMEKIVKGTLVGPTAQCIIGEQFYRTRRGDRFFYSNGEKPSHFTPDQLAQIRKYTWSRLVCDTSSIEKIQPHGFKKLSENNPLVHCSSIPYINLEAWRELPSGYN